MTDATTYLAFANALNALKAGWEVTPRGVSGPEGALVRLAHRHESSAEGHVDVQFVMDEDAALETPLWDCVSGFGDTPGDRAITAARIWSQTTAGALLELKYAGRGEFADHYRGTERDGWPNWHAISGAILGFGTGDSHQRLQRWWLEHPLLPTLATALAGSVDGSDGPHGIKILFGGTDVAEVRLDGEAHGPASAALTQLDWPRLEPAGFVRSYVVLVHREA